VAIFLVLALSGLWAMGWIGASFFAGDAVAQSGITLMLMVVYVLPLTLLYGGWRQRALKRIWTDRGARDPLAMQWIVDESGFTVIQPAQETRITWDGVSEIIPHRKHWLIVANMAAHCVPRHCFADVAAERAFIAAAVAQLSEIARGRSPEAVAFAN
jgi:hypothetical protein